MSTWFTNSREPPTDISAGMAHHPKVHTIASCLLGFPGGWKSPFNVKCQKDPPDISWPPRNSNHQHDITALGSGILRRLTFTCQCYWKGGKHPKVYLQWVRLLPLSAVILSFKMAQNSECAKHQFPCHLSEFRTFKRYRQSESIL